MIGNPDGKVQFQSLTAYEGQGASMEELET